MKSILKKDKKGLSEMIGYVLLIVIALSISIAVYGWVKYQLPKQKDECHEDTALVIEDYECENNQITLTMRNRGLFEVNGFYVRVRKVGDTGLPTRKVGYDIDGDGEIEYDVDTNGDDIIDYDEKTNEIFTPSQPSTEFVVSLDYSYLENGIDIIEIEPFEYINEKIVACENAVVKQELEGC